MRATGMTDEDIKKPFIAICNSFNEVIPGHVHLNKVANIITEECCKVFKDRYKDWSSIS